jgi:hypothetical protein
MIQHESDAQVMGAAAEARTRVIQQQHVARAHDAVQILDAHKDAHILLAFQFERGLLERTKHGGHVSGGRIWSRDVLMKSEE